MRLSLALTLRDVCHLRPARGAEILAQLSTLVRVENGTPVARAVGLQALEYLCRADVLDWRTAWMVVGKERLGSDASLPPVVIAAVYGFLATGNKENLYGKLHLYVCMLLCVRMHVSVGACLGGDCLATHPIYTVWRRLQVTNQFIGPN